MIARAWRAVTTEAQATQYMDYLMNTAVRDIHAAEGNRGVEVLRRVFEGRAEFLMVSYWESWDAIYKIYGQEIDKPLFYPEEQQYLVDTERVMAHYEIMLDSKRISLPV